MQKYKYNHDCPFEAYITNLNAYNNGKIIGKWLKFPSTEEQLNDILSKIGVDNKYREWFVSDYDIYVDNIKNKLMSFMSFEELNIVAKEFYKTSN